MELGYDHIAEGDLDVWCSAPPQLVEHVKVVSPTGKTIEGAYIDSCFVPEMLGRFKTARRKVLNAMELAQKKGINITALGGFTSIIFENFNLLQHKHIRNTTLEWERFTTGNTHTAWVICRQLEINAPSIGIDLKKAKVAVVGATGDIGSAVCRWLSRRTGVAELLLVARQEQPLMDLQKELGGGQILGLDDALSSADVVVWVASMPRTLEIDSSKLRNPCLMIDGGYPKNLDNKVSGEGVHVLKGGIVEFFNDIGWNMMELAAMEKPQRQMFACFAEAMLLEFENCHTNFSWGRNNITLEKMDFIGKASVRNGFSTLNLNNVFQAAAA
ncbi:MAG: long-chain acyl-[acyl-carrier-protein] reductase [Prochlorococcaceae cyanobacterium ETNP1_MAG_9]|nr:long-chain acyl-[acyl-carrier-protein] reductase [Prochlorococcaceae cyanobacterium ETNP1_MAG_9]